MRTPSPRRNVPALRVVWQLVATPALLALCAAPRVAAAQSAVPASTTARVAVIGAGPGGLAAALELQNQGVDVTVFESRPVTAPAEPPSGAAPGRRGTTPWAQRQQRPVFFPQTVSNLAALGVRPDRVVDWTDEVHSYNANGERHLRLGADQRRLAPRATALGPRELTTGTDVVATAPINRVERGLARTFLSRGGRIVFGQRVDDVRVADDHAVRLVAGATDVVRGPGGADAYDFVVVADGGRDLSNNLGVHFDSRGTINMMNGVIATPPGLTIPNRNLSATVRTRAADGTYHGLAVYLQQDRRGMAITCQVPPGMPPLSAQESREFLLNQARAAGYDLPDEPHAWLSQPARFDSTAGRVDQFVRHGGRVFVVGDAAFRGYVRSGLSMQAAISTARRAAQTIRRLAGIQARYGRVAHNAAAAERSPGWRQEVERYTGDVGHAFDDLLERVTRAPTTPATPSPGQALRWRFNMRAATALPRVRTAPVLPRRPPAFGRR